MTAAPGALPTPANPFPGLRPFREAEEYLFFGREHQVDAMIDTLARTRFLAVVGTSGSGKSSLVNCGLRPALHGGVMARAGTAWRMAQFRPGSNPLRALARALAGDGVLFHNYEPRGLTLAEIVDTTLRMSKLGLIDIYEQAALEEDVNLLVVVDQFEELFRYRQLGAGPREGAEGASEAASAFVNLLLEARAQTACPIHVVLTMRSDFLGDCTQFPGLAEAINAGQYLVPRMTRDERRAAIVGPVGVGGAEISPVLVTRLVNDVGDNPDQLSILQHALNRTWARWQHEGGGHGPLDLVHYEAIGTMAHALDQHAERAFAELGTPRQRQVCAKLFKALTDKATDPRGIRRPTTLATVCALADATAAEVTDVIDVFREPSRSFLMPPAGEPIEATTVIDISHESLMRVWQRLNTWADEEARSAQTYRRLADTAALHAAGTASLWRDPDLTYAREWQAREAPNAPWAERYHPGFDAACAFLRESEAAHAAELAQERRRADAERMAQERELEQARALAEAQRLRADEQAAARIRQRRTSWGLAAILGLALAAAWFGWHQKRAAEEHARLAQRNAREAAEQRTVADASRLEAERQQGIAERKATEATQQRTIADEQRRVAETQQQLAESQGRLALSRQLAVYTDRATGGGPQVALLLGAAANRIAPTNEARQVLQRAFTAQPQLRAFLVGHRQKVWSVAFSPDSKTLASSDQGGAVILWDVASRTPLGGPLKRHQAVVRSVAFSPDGKTLASASEDTTVILWDVARRRPLGEPLQSQGRVSSVAFSPDGKLLAVAADAVTLWDVASRRPLGEPLRRPAESVAFSPDGKVLAATGGGGVVLWDVASGQLLGEPLSHKEGGWSVAFSPDGRTLVTGGNDGVTLWDVASRKPLGKPMTRHQGEVYGVAFSPDGTMLASGGWDHTVIRWNVARGEPRPAGEPLTHRERVNGVSFSPDGKTLASASDDQTVILWEVAGQAPLGDALKGHGRINGVAFSPDGQLLAAATGDAVTLWDVVRRRPRGEPLKGPSGSVAFSPDGTVLAATASGGVILWHVARGKPLGPPLKSPHEVGGSVVFSPNGRTLAAGGNDGVTLWDVAGRTPLGEPLKSQSRVYSVAFSPDGTMLAAGGSGLASARQDATVVLWDLARRRPLGEPLKTSWYGVYSVAFSPDGRTLVAAGDKVALWDVASRKPLGEPIQTESSRAVAFSPDGTTLASTSGDGNTVLLWDVASRKLRGEPFRSDEAGYDHRRTTVAFTRDGKTLASGGPDGTVILWDVDTASWVRRACAVAGRNLTRREWAQYAGEDVPYQTPCPDLPVPKD